VQVEARDNAITVASLNVLDSTSQSLKSSAISTGCLLSPQCGKLMWRKSGPTVQAISPANTAPTASAAPAPSPPCALAAFFVAAAGVDEPADEPPAVLPAIIAVVAVTPLAEVTVTVVPVPVAVLVAVAVAFVVAVAMLPLPEPLPMALPIPDAVAALVALAETLPGPTTVSVAEAPEMVSGDAKVTPL
jgi:hypothetical protein